MSKIVLAMRTTAPSNSPHRRGYIPLLATFEWETALKKWSLFKQHFSNEKQCLGPKKGIFSLFGASRGGGAKSRRNPLILGKMLIKIFSHYRLIFRGVLNVLIMSTEQGG
jgi:hypothetical protein